MKALDSERHQEQLNTIFLRLCSIQTGLVGFRDKDLTSAYTKALIQYRINDVDRLIMFVQSCKAK